MSGPIFENYVINEIRKSYGVAGRDAPLYYYRDRDGVEIDLLLEADGTLHPLEIKKTATPKSCMTLGFKALRHVPLQRGTGGIICAALDLGAIDSQTLIIPAWMV